MVSAARYLAGVGIAMCTTFMSALGLALQKKAHVYVAQARAAAIRAGKDPDLIKTTRQKRWLFGLLFLGLTAVVSLAVFALVGQSVASCFASITIVWNIGFACACGRRSALLPAGD